MLFVLCTVLFIIFLNNKLLSMNIQIIFKFVIYKHKDKNKTKKKKWSSKCDYKNYRICFLFNKMILSIPLKEVLFSYLLIFKKYND